MLGLGYWPIAATCALLQCVLLLCVPSPALAQSSRVLLVADAEVPNSIQRSVKHRLARVADVLDSEAYREAARAARLPPDSEEALTSVAPRAGARVIVHIEISDDALRAELRRGSDGSVLRELSFPMSDQRFKAPGRALKQLSAATSEALAALTGEPEPGLHNGAGPAQRAELSASAEATGRTGSEVASPPTTAEPRLDSRAAEEPAGDEIMEDPELRARLELPTSHDDAPRKGLLLRAGVGMGPGLHSLTVPSAPLPGTDAEVDTGLAPVLELAGAAQINLDHWILGAEAQYRTFFAVEPAPLPAQPGAPGDPSASGANAAATVGNVAGMSSALRSQSLVIGASPGYRFGGSQSVALLMTLGWTYRSLHPEVAALPGASFTGFVGRPSLLIPFGGGVFTLRLAPELIVVRSSQTNGQGAAATRDEGGMGLGGEGAIDMRLAKLLMASVQYRHSRVTLRRTAAGPATDAEWYVTVQAVLSL